ncbi:MAG: hypothetical protein M3N21_08590 [Actinomycetota bacterium]|nr:hypothetical protein [Actinomycetota bacterium]
MSAARLGEYRKGLVALVTLLGQILALGVLSGNALHYAQLALAVLTAVGVVLVPNDPPRPSTPSVTPPAAPSPL